MFEVGKKYTPHHTKAIYTCIAVFDNWGWLKRDTENAPSGYQFANYWSEYKEPLKVSGWVNLYYWKGKPDPGNWFYDTKEEALARAAQMTSRGNTHLATVYVSGEEGKEP